MGLSIIQGNAIEGSADGIIITIDGAAKGMEGKIARAFARRWPELWEELEDEITYPIPLGTVFEYEPVSESPFKLILVASTLHHKDTLSENQKKSIASNALEQAMMTAFEYSIDKVNSGLMLGGWRLSPTSAFIAMAEGYEACMRKGKSVDLDIYVLDAKHFDVVKSVATSMGWRE